MVPYVESIMLPSSFRETEQISSNWDLFVRTKGRNKICPPYTDRRHNDEAASLVTLSLDWSSTGNLFSPLLDIIANPQASPNLFSLAKCAQ